MGCYLSQDPIGLAGNNPTIYGYVHDPNSWVDVLGLLSFFRGSDGRGNVNFTPKPNEYRIDPNTGLVRTTHGVSVFDNAESVLRRGFTPYEIDMNTVSDKLQIKQRGLDPHHFEIMPKSSMPEMEYKAELSKIKCK